MQSMDTDSVGARGTLRRHAAWHFQTSHGRAIDSLLPYRPHWTQPFHLLSPGSAWVLWLIVISVMQLLRASIPLLNCKVDISLSQENHNEPSSRCAQPFDISVWDYHLQSPGWHTELKKNIAEGLVTTLVSLGVCVGHFHCYLCDELTLLIFLSCMKKNINKCTLAAFDSHSNMWGPAEVYTDHSCSLAM